MNHSLPSITEHPFDTGRTYVINSAGPDPDMASGTSGNDIFHAKTSGRTEDQIHIMAGDGDDILNLNLDVLGLNTIQHGHHVFGGKGADRFIFQNLEIMRGTVVGRIDDLTSEDSIFVGSQRLDLSRPQAIKGFSVQVVLYNGQQWLEMKNLVGGRALYNLEGARQKLQPDGTWADEVHFLHWNQKLPDALPLVRYEDPINFIPVALKAHFRADHDLSAKGDLAVPVSQKGTDQNDLIVTRRGGDWISGGAGNDSIDGFMGSDTIYGGSGNDLIEGGKGLDRLWGEKGDDILSGGTDDDTLVGGAGNDILFGGSENDVLIGDMGNDSLYGGSGNDRLSVVSGTNLLDGGPGNDVLIGGAGSDTMSGNGGHDLLQGGESGDRLFGMGGNDRIGGGGGHDIISGGAGNDALFGGTGNDQLQGDEGNDRLSGMAGNDRIGGGAGHDIIIGGAGNDALFGGAGNDDLAAEGGRDTLDGGAGNDLLRGGAGADQFIFTSSSDTIRNFDRAEDVINLRSFSGLDTWGDVRSQLVQAGQHVEFRQGGHTLKIEGTKLSDLGADDFIW